MCEVYCVARCGRGLEWGGSPPSPAPPRGPWKWAGLPWCPHGPGMFKLVPADPACLCELTPRRRRAKIHGVLSGKVSAVPRPRFRPMSSPGKAMRDGVLEKRSSGLLQLWKKKRCVLTDDGLRLLSCRGDAPRAKELRFERMVTVDCVEYKRGLVYFTVVMTTGKEIDFRCPQDGAAWNAEIALALVRYKNLQAVRTGRNRHLSTAHLGSTGEDVEL